MTTNIRKLINAPGIELTIRAVIHKQRHVVDCASPYSTFLLVDSSGAVTVTIFENSSQKFVNVDELRNGEIYDFRLQANIRTNDVPQVYLNGSRRVEDLEMSTWYENEYKDITFPTHYGRIKAMKSGNVTRINIKGTISLIGNDIPCRNNAKLRTYNITDDTDNINIGVFGEPLPYDVNTKIFLRNLKVDKDPKNNNLRYTFDSFSDFISCTEKKMESDVDKSLFEQSPRRSNSSTHPWFSSRSPNNESSSRSELKSRKRGNQDCTSQPPFLDLLIDNIEKSKNKKEFIENIMECMRKEPKIRRGLNYTDMINYLANCFELEKTNKLHIIPSLFNIIKSMPIPSTATFVEMLKQVYYNLSSEGKVDMTSKLLHLCPIQTINKNIESDDEEDFFLQLDDQERINKNKYNNKDVSE